jgi:hypothetical protein
MKSLFQILGAVLLIGGTASAQVVAQGPFAGSIPGGVSVTTNNFGPDSPSGEPSEELHNPYLLPVYSAPPNMPPPAGPEGSNYIEDPSVHGFDGPPPITVGSFVGLGQAQSAGFPPDPYLAVGPNHIITTINNTFRISTKDGTTLKTISANSWFATTISGVSYSDPKVAYDHFANRWIITWLSYNTSTQVAYDMVSVSDDSDPIGTWYNWAIPSHLNGSTNTGTFGDYPGLGFDNQALYITSNQFTFPGSYQFAKIRIIPKAQLYANTAGPVTWNDFSQVVDLFGNTAAGIRPSIIRGVPNVYYLMLAPSFTSGTYFVLYRITNPVTSPSVSAVHVPVVAWTSAPNSNQLGGGSTLIESGGSRIRNEPVYMDSSIWAVHNVASGSGNQYASIHYVRISTVTNTVILGEDIVFGADGFWLSYPALTVDKDKNIAITFCRSGLTEYIGAYFSWRLNNDPPGLRPTVPMQAGKGNYVVVAGGRNRWGDYVGIGLDPADQNNIWMFTEYAAATNTFGDWVHGARLVPYSGSKIFLDKTSIDQGLVEVGNISDTASVAIFNIGASSLTVSSITRTQSQYSLLNVPTLPANLSSFDSLRFKVIFRPTAHALITDTIRIVSNDVSNPTVKIPLSAKGIIIVRARVANVYSTSSATNPPSQLYTINQTTGAPTAIGPTGITEIQGLAVRPTTQELYGTLTSTTSTTIYRVSSGFGDALPVRTFNIGNMRAIAFNRGDSLYGGTTTGRLYRLNLATGDTTYIGTAPSIFYAGLAFSPITRKLYASVRPPISGRDMILTVDITNGDTALVGSTGFSTRITPGITFNAIGTLYGITGSGTQVNELIRIDTATGVGTLIASTGITGLNALALRTDSLSTGVEEQTLEIPTAYILDQNYPNPFNPTTSIRYGLPQQSLVKVAIYNVVGQEVVRLFEGEQPAGFHAVTWSGASKSGAPVSSGVYLYRLEADGGTGKSFIQSRKMVLVK